MHKEVLDRLKRLDARDPGRLDDVAMVLVGGAERSALLDRALRGIVALRPGEGAFP